MHSSLAQPDARPLHDDLLAAVLRAVLPGDRAAEPASVRFHDSHSNDLVEVGFADGRVLMVKRGRYAWSAERFDTSRRASELVRARRAALVPEPLPLPHGLDEGPLEAYWRVQRPTLQELWPSLSARQRDAALTSWGRLVRQVHQVRLAGYGPLQRAQGPGTLEDDLRGDLADRLLPAVYGEWPDGVESLERMLQLLPALAERARGRPAVLVHNDLHMGNVLCDVDGAEVRCVGLLDLEAARAGLPEADLAIAEVQHGPLFSQALPAGWIDRLMEGYAQEADPLALSFYRAYHLANMGFWSALVGHDHHAREVALALRDEIETLARAAAGGGGTGLAQRSGERAAVPQRSSRAWTRAPRSTLTSTTP